jgi:glycosyltransferase involved in cell wall biosynthesis
MYDVTILVRVMWPGGPQRIAVCETESLREAGFNVNLTFIRSTNRDAEWLHKTQSNIIFDVSANKRTLQKLFYMLTKHFNNGRGKDATVDLDLIALYEIQKNYSKVVIYYDQFTALFSILRKVRKPFKKVVFIHETSFREKSFLKKTIERIALLDSDLIITNSEFNREVLLKHGYKNVELLYPGIEVKKEYKEFDERNNTCVVVTVFEKWRKPELLLDIASCLKQAKIIMAGQWADDDYRRSIEEEINQRNLQNRIRITGLITERELINIYECAKVSLRFGFDEHGPGMGSLESIGFGIPIIVNTGIGIVELLQKYNYDLIFSDTDIQGISETIDKLTVDRAFWNKYHDSITSIAHKNSWNIHNDKLCSLIRQLSEDDVSIN